MDEGQFDYQQVSEEPESLDFSKKVPCPYCKKLIPQDATMCLYCGEEVALYKRSTWKVWLALVLAVIFIAVVLVYR